MLYLSKKTMVCIPTNSSDDIDITDKYIFIDDKSINNKIIYMVFDNFIPDYLVNYFELIGDNIAMIKNNMRLTNGSLNELRKKEYKHLLFYYEGMNP